MTASWSIRPADPADAAAIASLWNPWISATMVTFNSAEKSAADVAQIITERQVSYGFWVAECGDSLLGFVTYSQFRGGIGYAKSMEHTIILEPKARGQGVGRALMAVVESDAASKGAHMMIAAVSAENDAGRAFHTALAYAEVAVIPQAGFKFSRFHDLVLMQKFLA